MVSLSLRDCLGIHPDGKLERLHLAGMPLDASGRRANVLQEWDQELDLGGRFFRPAGWDECFPTIDPYPGSPVMGELIGLPPEMNWQEDRVEQIWRTPRFDARRCFRLTAPPCLEMDFQAICLQETPLDYLWASHCLLDVAKLQTMRLASGDLYRDFDHNGSEQKIFVRNLGPLELQYSDFRVVFTTDQPYWGLWINRGGWPANCQPALLCLGVEATNTAGEIPAGQRLDPGAIFTGKVRLEIHS
ncbi:MAG: hypothetical protein HY835_07890 [Anaerolineae bacterium]|nr:hypothetical protein [Anaerolineae bacterium]